MSLCPHMIEGVSPIASLANVNRAPWILGGLLAELVLAATAAAAVMGAATLLPVVLLASCSALLVLAAASQPSSDGPGPADLVTGLRLGMAIGIGVSVLCGSPPGGLVAALLLLALSTDAADGWIARRTASATRFGARFDLETDAVLLGAASLAAMPVTGPFVLAAPLLRPAWLLAGRALPWLERPLPPSLRRRILCALPIFLLLAVPWPLAGSRLAVPAAALAVLLLAASFLIDLAHQWQQRRVPGPAA
ncbi:CDP-alcohol phosphatidyltransferase family protein [Geminicoccus harenae]|uniref:CDP-alcohol phosphatidyltransferase family protein n=1 Tax=Geminicoccus harenae TaxID=2498453 RepID=UPI001C959546|nr:CDP-alcohol phosphatidyltransferase family protein [Geminicoccus harenae]